MIFAIIAWNGRERLCCVDKTGRRAFLTEEFFKRDLSGYGIDSNRIDKIPESMEELIRNYNVLWTDDMALFFGSNPDLGIALDAAGGWAPLVRTEEAWSPLEEIRGKELLE